MDPYTCEDFFRRLDDYLDKELSVDDMQRMSEHLQVCQACLSEYRFEKGVLDDVKAKLRRVVAPPGLMARISQALPRGEG